MYSLTKIAQGVKQATGRTIRAAKPVVAAVATSALALGYQVAHAAGESPLVAAAQTETANTKGDMAAMGAVLIVVAIAGWGIFKLIGMFRR